MNKINKLFAEQRETGRKLLSLYFCAGCPTLESTAEVIKTLERRGIDMIEVGIPFSDPLADGIERFCQSCVECGASGAIIPDLPFKDYLDEVKPIADKYDLRIIMMITPETSEERIRFIDEHTDGFIYMVSSASITGAQNNFDEAKQEYFRHINSMNLRNPRMIGFGISNKQTLESAQKNAAGAIIGSKFVTLLNEANGDAEKAMDNLYAALEQ